MGITLVQLRDDATQHCRTCPRASRIGNASVTCDGTLIAYANGVCPLGLWDHSAPIVHAPQPRVPYVQICMGRHLEWPVKVWEQIQKCPLHGRKYHVPRELYDAIKDEWLG